VLTKRVALTLDLRLESFCGGWNRKLPRGGFAYGIPKYSETPGAPSDACPRTIPLVVWTGPPTFPHCGAAHAVPGKKAATARAVLATRQGFMF
jgi:hypothetical protein